MPKTRPSPHHFIGRLNAACLHPYPALSTCLHSEHCLCRACSVGKLESAKALVLAKARLNIKDQSGMTPLALAASCGHDFCALWLASQGATIEVHDKLWMHHCCSRAPDHAHVRCLQLHVR